MLEMSQTDDEDISESEIDSLFDRTTFKLECLDSESSALATKLALIAGGNSQSSAANSSCDDQINVDAETQARLEALLEAAGIGKLSTTDGKAFADPEVLRKLSSSVSCALDEAAAALSKMKAESETANEQSHQRTLVEACNAGDVNTVKRFLCEGRGANETTEDGESLLSVACSAGYYELAEVLLSVPPYTDESTYLTCESSKQLRNKISPTFLATLNQQLTKVLLSMHAEINDCGAKGECTPLMEAASGGYTDIVRLLVSRGADINAISSTGNTALTYACCGGFEDVVQLLVDRSAILECHNENGHTPLMEAASGGHVGVAAILLDNGVGINTHSNEFKESALTLACYKGHLKMVKFLLQAGADQEHKTDEMHTALMEASMDGHVEVARLLLDSGAQVNMPADSFESPLTLAACGGHVDLAELLIHRGAALEEVNDEGYTPLMEAAREGHEEMVALLLAAGANANAKTEETQETALTLACCGGFLECAEALIRAGADIETGCSTPLMEAAQEGQLELVKFLINQGAIVTAATSSGDTALSYACENGHTDVADLLLSAGAVLEHETELGRTPLMKAARAGHLCTVQFLISRGADVNHTTKNNEHSVLSLACVCGHLSVVELLLCQGADATHKLKDGSTLLLEASKGGHTAVVQLLLDFPHNFMTLPPETNQVTSPTPEQMTPRVPTQALPMVVPPQQPDESPELPPLADSYEHFEENLDPENLNIKITECADELQNLYMQQLRSNQNPQQQQQQLQQVEDVAQPPDNSFNMSALVTHLIQQGGLLTTTYDYLPPDAKKAVDKDVAVTVDSFLRSMASDGAAGKPRTAESIVEEAQEKLTELEQRIKEAIEKNAQLKSIEIMQNNQMTKEKVEELYKTREEHIHKKQKILEELQKVRELKVERELQLKTQQQLKKHYEELKQNEQSSSQRGKPDGQEIEKVNQANCSSSQFLEEIISEDRVTEGILNKTYEIEEESDWVLRKNSSDGGKLVSQIEHKLNNGSSGLLPQAASKEMEDPFCHCIHHPCPQLSHPQPDEPKMDPNQANMTPVPGFNSQQQLTPYPHLEIDGHTESNHDTPLTLACAGGHEDLVQLLISRGANIEHRDKKGFTPLILAATAGHVGVVSILLEANSDIEAQSERTKDTPLSLACSGGRFEVVDLLLERGANKEHRNVSDYTPLSLAASGGYVNIIKLLLTQGAEINSRTGSKLGISPLMLAAMNGHTTAVQLLLDMGADINAQIETNRNTALTLACFQGRHEVVSLLVDRKANVEHRAKTGLTPLMEAASGGYADVGRVLLDKGADPNAAPVPSSRDTALTIAADKGHYRFCELVLTRGAQVEVRNKKGNTPLWLACNGGHLDVVMLLVGKGADVNAADNRNVIPLMSAFRKGNVQVVKWLATEVSQFPSDAECMRYIATISDRELLKRSHQCMECIVQAKDRQAQEANKFASELLEELDMEKNQEENRKERAARKREKRRLKRKQKSTKKVDDEKEDDDDDMMENDFKSEKENVQEIIKQTEKLEIAPKTFASDTILPLSTASVLNESSRTNNATTVVAVSSTHSTSRVQTVLKPSIKPPAPVTMTTNSQSQQAEAKVPQDSRRRNHHNESASSSGETSPRIHSARKVRKSTVVRSSSTHEPSAPSKITIQPPRNPPVSSHTYRNSSVSVVTPSPIKVAPSPSKVGPSPGKRGHRREEALGWKEVTRKYPSNTNTPKRIMVSSNLISRVIGRGGCNINAIREVTGAHIDIDKQRKGGHERTVTIKGAAEAIRHAHQLITALIKEDRTDQEISQIIAKAKALASQNLTSKQPVSSKMTVTVVAAPMPSKPAWTVPPSIVAHSVIQPRPQPPPTSTVKVGVWSPPATTAAVTAITSESESVVTSQSNKWGSSQSSSASNPSPPSITTTTSEAVPVNQAVKPVVTVDSAKRALFSAPQSTASAPVTFSAKNTDKPISKPIQTVAPMMSTKVATAPATRLSQTSFGPVGSGLPSHHHHVFPNNQVVSQQATISSTSNMSAMAMSHASNRDAMSHAAMSPVQPIAPLNLRSVTPNRVTSSQAGHLSSSQFVSSSSAPPMAFGPIMSDPNPNYSAPPSYSPFNSSFTPAAGSSALWNNEPNNALSPYQSAMNGIIEAEPVDQSKAPGYRGNMKSPAVVENGIIGGSTSQPAAASNNLENASPVNSHQGSPNTENSAEVITKPTPIGTERANRRAINPCLPLPTNLNPPSLNQPNFNEDTGIWSYDTISLGNIGMDSLDGNAKYGNWSQVIGSEGTTTTNTSNKPQVTASEIGTPSKLSQNENSAQIRPFYPPQPYPNRAQPPIGSHLGGSSSVGVVGPQQLQPIGSHLGGAGHNRGNTYTQMQQRTFPNNSAMQQQHHQQQQQPRYQVGPYHLQQNDVMSRYMQNMGADHSSWQMQQQHSMYARQPHVNLYQQKETQQPTNNSIGGMYNSLPTSMGDAHHQGAYSDFPLQQHDYPQYFDPNMVRANNYQNSSGWEQQQDMCRPNAGYSNMNGGPDTPLVNGQPSVDISDNHQGWREWS